MPPQTRAPMISLSACEKRAKCLEYPGNLGLWTSKAILSVPKKGWSGCTVALLLQLWPDGCSGKGGVTSGVPVVAVDGSNSGFQSGSATVPGLPSVSASWMAVIGRHELQWALSFQQPMEASAAARSSMA